MQFTTTFRLADINITPDTKSCSIADCDLELVAKTYSLVARLNVIAGANWSFRIDESSTLAEVS